MDEGVETALAVTDDLFLIEGMEVRLECFVGEEFRTVFNMTISEISL